ncbi:MAG: DNA mismatch repair endonuclease MutL [Phycisphaerales bacterium]|nr:DNA mismatch repair endonuclease MutL [Phycisphaerales bacterium]
MGIIRTLPQSLISRIAAGECIERPASVVKELVENALDAGAGRIEITLRDGGRELIAVSDDGGGMDPDDLVPAVTQHATSKIREDADLFNIQSMGFRGEALASIASVARVRLVSRRPGADVAHELTVEAGELGAVRPCTAPPGTTVEVRDLFYAVPARRKFLRTNQTEVGHVTEQLARIALAHPEVEFLLRSQDRVTHRLAATGDRRQRIADFYGEELARVLLPVRRDGDGVVVEGLVAPPQESRGSGKWEYVFLNGRYIRDRFVSHAVKEAYRSLIDPHRYPVVFLFLTVRPTDVDVNVHPTKIEVRWRDSNYVHGQVLAALREKFLGTRLEHRLQGASLGDDERERVRQAMVDFFTHPPRTSYEGRPRVGAMAPPQHAPDVGAPSPQATQDQPGAGPADNSAAVAPGAQEARNWPAAPARPPTARPMPSAALDMPTAAARALQVHRSYLVVETDDGVMIIDQHALHERILYEELRQRIAERRLETQRLLLPEIVRVPPDRLEALESHAELLAQVGIELTAAGPQSVALQSFPTLLLERVDQSRFVLDLLDLLAEQGRRATGELLLHRVLDMMACKAAVKAGDPLTPDEIAALLARREHAERSSHCPHGRPTTLRLSLRDLERQFHRR